MYEEFFYDAQISNADLFNGIMTTSDGIKRICNPLPHCR